MKVWAKTDHTYWDNDSRVWRRIPAREWRDIPDAQAMALLRAYPHKLVRHDPFEFRTVVMSGPPAHRQMRPNG